MPQAEVKSMVDQHTRVSQFGLLGQTRINVLKLNIALDELARKGKG
jgi:K+-transporting ATPase c subunit